MATIPDTEGGPTTKKARSSPIKGEGSPTKAVNLSYVNSTRSDNQQGPKKWDDSEEAIFAELAEDVLKSEMWQKVKADGRLVHRKADGIKQHVKAFVSTADSVSELTLRLVDEEEEGVAMQTMCAQRLGSISIHRKEPGCVCLDQSYALDRVPTNPFLSQSSPTV